MTVKELVDLLQKEDQTKQVYFSSDEEGNTLHAKADVSLTEIEEGETAAVVIYPLNTNEDIH